MCLSFSFALSIAHNSLGTRAVVKIQMITITINISTNVKERKEEDFIGKRILKNKKGHFAIHKLPTLSQKILQEDISRMNHKTPSFSCKKK
jgi:hypothetical protein